MKAAFVDLNGVRTRYLYAGEGPPLLLLHGVGLSADCFVRNIDALARRFSVYAPDLLGHGFSDAVDFRGEPPQLHTIKQISHLADHLKLVRYSIGGFSYGAQLAALMYFDQPPRIVNLLLVGSGSVFHPPESQKAAYSAAFANGSAAMSDATLDSCRRRLAAICFDPKSVAEEILLAQLTSYAVPSRLQAYKATIAGMIDSITSDSYRVYHRLEQLRVRSLIITGRDDIRAQWQLHLEGRKRMPNARLVVIDNCGHLPCMEHPQQFNTLVGDFLSGETVGE
jgi:2-hydroxy-6-oxonona-2,4-dienedioate hydrolase